MASIHAWAAFCGHVVDEVREIKEPGVTRRQWGWPGARDEVEFVAVDDLGHVWPGGHRLLPEALVGPASNRINATDEIWEFFRRHRRE
jgi:poly(3-hydroxybutyrate) depolymerase